MNPAALPSLPVRGASPCLENRCSACCHDTEMLLTQADVTRISALRPGVDFWFTTPDGYRQLRTRDDPAAAGGSGRPCVFLAPNGTCSIHDLRPEGCRLYPAVWNLDDQAAQLDDENCPHTSRFLLAPAARDAAKRLAARLENERRRD